MIEVSREIPASPGDVFAVLADGWSYSGWVVGTTHIRDVDPGWPDVGSRIHHSLGAWPMQIADVTEVISVRPGHSLELDAQLWLLGTARIRLDLTPTYDGFGTQVVMAEQIVRGPGGRIPAPVQGLALRPRNVESLARLADLVVGRVARPQHAEEKLTEA